MGNWVGDNWNSVDAYGTSGTPWAETVTLSTGAVTVIKFPAVTRWVQIYNTNGTATNTAKVGFTTNGVNGNPDDNFFIVNGGTNSGRLEVRCLELHLKAGAGTPIVSIVAGVTQIQKSHMFDVTGSNGVEGVG